MSPFSLDHAPFWLSFYVLLCHSMYRWALKKLGWENIWLWMLQTLLSLGVKPGPHITIFGSVFFSVSLGVG